MVDVILHGGTIHTLDDVQPRVNALAFDRGRIARIGRNDAVLSMASPETKVVDLQGKTVIPGLSDAHGHMRSLGQLQEQVDLAGARSFLEVVELMREAARGTPKGEWVLGRRWNQELWADRTLPEHHILSKAVPDNPVWLVRVDGHAGLANEAAMRSAAVDSTTGIPSGGLVLKVGGVPSGLFVDRAMALISNHIPSIDVETAKRFLLTAQDLCLANGLTEIHDAGIGHIEMKAYRSLVAEGKLKIRVYAMLSRDFFNQEDHVPLYEGVFTARSVKIVLDGALGSRGAALLEPYSDFPQERGFLLMSLEEFRATISRALAQGFQINTHAIGDYANRIVLNTLQESLRSRNVPDHRSRIEHAQIVALEDIPRYARLGVIASVQPTHATSDMNMAEARVGPERIRGAYAWRKFIGSGVRVASGSDFPVEDSAPLLGLYAATTRQDRRGQPEGGWYPGERMTMDEALRSFTTGPAYAAFQEKQSGTISEGKWANLTIVNRDILAQPPSELLKAEVLATIVAGDAVFSRIPQLQPMPHLS